jgi:hypothetical protein
MINVELLSVEVGRRAVSSFLLLFGKNVFSKKPSFKCVASTRNPHSSIHPPHHHTRDTLLPHGAHLARGLKSLKKHGKWEDVE